LAGFLLFLHIGRDPGDRRWHSCRLQHGRSTGVMHLKEPLAHHRELISEHGDSDGGSIAVGRQPGKSRTQHPLPLDRDL
jgi:hypothetical protein